MECSGTNLRRWRTRLPTQGVQCLQQLMYVYGTVLLMHHSHKIAAAGRGAAAAGAGAHLGGNPHQTTGISRARPHCVPAAVASHAAGSGQASIIISDLCTTHKPVRETCSIIKIFCACTILRHCNKYRHWQQTCLPRSIMIINNRSQSLPTPSTAHRSDVSMRGFVRTPLTPAQHRHRQVRCRR